MFALLTSSMTQRATNAGCRGLAAASYSCQLPQMRIRSWARRLTPSLFLLLGTIADPLGCNAQASPPDSIDWRPQGPSLTVGYLRVVGDGESSTRVEASWYQGDNLRVLGTARLWDYYDVVELEVRWLRARSSVFRPFIATSVVWQDQSRYTSVGGTVGVGLETYPIRPVVTTATLAWQSLFAQAGGTSNHWFRFSAGLSIALFPLE